MNRFALPARLVLPVLIAGATLFPRAAFAQEAATAMPLTSPPAAAQPAEAPATVVVTSDNLDVRVGYVTARADAVASNGVGVSAMGWKNVCMAPCKFQLEPGLHELIASGPGYTPAIEEVSLNPGENRFRVKPGSSYMRWGGWALVSLGVAGLATGITFAAIGTTNFNARGQMTKTTPGFAIPLAIGGGVGVAGGITLVALSGTSIRRDAGSPAGERATRAPGLAYSGAF